LGKQSELDLQGAAFGALPTPGEVEFPFADLTPEQVITGLSPRDFPWTFMPG
jgi:hypothetical protein